MKKLVLVSLVLMVALPAVARVDVWCTTDGVKKEVTVHYSTDANLPRAFALDITCKDANIVSVNDVNTAGYWVYPGSIDIIVSGGNADINDYGTSVADANLYPGTLSGPNGIMVEMGSLYVGAANEPDSNGILLTFLADGTTDVNFALNTIRGGIVMEDPNEEADPNLCGCTLNTECFPSAYTTQYNNWVAMGRPDCWCPPPYGNGYQCDGDADQATSGAPFNYQIYTGDLQMVIDNWKKKTTTAGINPCADIDHISSGAPFNYQVYTADLQTIINNWKKKSTALPGDCPRP
jgi:hypothetical protein